MKAQSHSDLCHLAARWLKRPYSRKGPGCHVAFTEVPSGFGGEIPDAIGFRACDDMDGSVVVEVKVSRADFQQDSKKPHRNGENPGLGRWRYFMCPEGLIDPSEVPDQWGLLYVSPRGVITPIIGPASVEGYGAHRNCLKAMSFDRDMSREQFILVRLLYRINDPEAVNQRVRKAEGESHRLKKLVETLNTELDDALGTRRHRTLIATPRSAVS